MPEGERRKKVIIVGGGFGGVRAAKAMCGVDADITVIDRSNHHLFQPLLYQVATAGLSPADIATPIRRLLRHQKNLDVILGEVVSIDTEKKVVCLDYGDALPYDYLVIATGARHSYFGHQEWEAVAPGLKSISDATAIRSKILAAFEFAERAHDEAERREWLTFVIVGGGPTGVEMAGSVSELAKRVLAKDFDHIDPRKSKIILVEASKRILGGLPEKLSNHATRDLKEMGVDVRLETMVQGIDSQGVDTSAGRIAARTVIWAAGVQASPAAQWLNAEADRSGRVKVQPNLSVPGHPEIFVIGDCAYLEQNGKPLPGVAQVAIQMGIYAGDLICRQIQGRGAKEPFRYKDKGNLATIGRRRAVADIGRFKFSGWFAWIVWVFIHIVTLMEFRNRLSVMVQWVWSYFTWGRGARIITPD